MASLIKNISGQHIKFTMVSATTGGADTAATVTVKVSIDAGAQAGGAGAVTNLTNGQYDYAPTQPETNGSDVGFLFTATGDIPVHVDFHPDPLNFNVLSIDATGNAAVTSNIKKNQIHNGFMFAMTDSTSHQFKTGLSFSAGQSQRSLDGAAFANTANLPTEVGNGVYTINLNASDTNANNMALLFTNISADPTLLIVLTQL
jgi:hypothetical protein